MTSTRLTSRSLRWLAPLMLVSIGLPAREASARQSSTRSNAKTLYARENLIAWCIVPFDSKKRDPETRARMLNALGFKHFAYDWRAEHIPTFDAEVDSLKKQGVSLDAWWVAPGELNKESQLILDVLKRHGVKAQLWVLLDLGPDKVVGDEQQRRVKAAAAKLKPLADAAKLQGCTIALYNHGGWFGEPENQIAIIETLKKEGTTNLGIVYNLHHGHDHLDRFPALLRLMKPHLLALNLNGMDPGGDRVGRKILPLGQGSADLALLKTIAESGYTGPIGILGHTMDDAEQRLHDNLDGLDWLLPQLDGKAPGPKPTPRTPVPAAPDGTKPKVGAARPYQPERLKALVSAAATQGDSRRGASVFASSQFGCMTCHKVGNQGGQLGPDLSELGRCQTAEYVAESVLWPRRQVNLNYDAIAVATTHGRIIQGYKQADTAVNIMIRDSATEELIQVAKSDIDEIKQVGTLMPDGLTESMTESQLVDLVRFLTDLGKESVGKSAALLATAHAPATFPFTPQPRHPELWPNRTAYVNRDRVYEYYKKEAEYFLKQAIAPSILPAYCGIDGGKYGHWGNQNDDVWMDDRWNKTDLGTVQAGIFRGDDIVVPKGVCVRLGDSGEMAACFNPETLTYDAVWTGGFLSFSPVRHGFMNGLNMKGKLQPTPGGTKPTRPFKYLGYHRLGKRIAFKYRIGDIDYFDAPWVENGKFTRTVAPTSTHPLASSLTNGSKQWPQVFKSKGKLGTEKPYAIDTIEPPFENPWNAQLFFGDHDFLADGTALLCTMQGDIWRVQGLDQSLSEVTWRRVASGLHQALGLVVDKEQVYVLCRDSIIRLHDNNADGEYDFYECINNSYPTSVAGHDFVCGLQRDKQGNFYTATGHLGLIKVPSNGAKYEVIATGFRNPDGVGLTPEGVLTVPCSEGEWTPSSMICEIKPNNDYGYGGPKGGKAPALPLAYLARGLDNSSGGQTTVVSDQWGPLKGQMLHFSFGTGTHFLVLRDSVGGQSQGAVVPLVGDFRSGIHRGRFHPRDGQLYVSGMTGWGTYTPDDGCFQRVRYTGAKVQLPKSFHLHENGVLVSFTEPVDRAIAADVGRQFAQAWNYRYSVAYGSPELSPSHPGQAGHDRWDIKAAHLLADGRSVFYEIPDLQPVNQLHLYLTVGQEDPAELFITAHRLDSAFTGFPGYKPTRKIIAAHPMERDMAQMNKTLPNPWRGRIAGSREIFVEAGTNLTFAPRFFHVKPGETIRLTFKNPDVVPHNWVLAKPGKLAVIGELTNKIISDPDAVLRHYVPRSEDILFYSDIVYPQDSFSINFRAPETKGAYPYLCTFPGHWMVMNGVMTVD